MRILHIGPFRLGRPSGHFNALWALARAQAARGNDVAIVRVGKPAAAADRSVARNGGVLLLGFPCPTWRGLWKDDTGVLAGILDEFQPDLAHLFYVRTPKFFYVARLLREHRIPYVVSLHGGMDSTEMRRRRYRKLVYWYAIEEQVHRHAAGIHFISEDERDDYRATRGIRRPADTVVSNVVELPPDAPAWRGLGDLRQPRLVYFGRYDVWHKGLDLALMMLRALREHGVFGQLHLYGGATGDLGETVRRLARGFPEVPIVDHGYVGSPEKFADMAGHDLYVQYSRFEAFGMSLAEAMSVGVPSLVSERSALAPALAAAGAALRLPMDPTAAAAVVADALRRPELLKDVASRGREWVRAECGADAVVERMGSFYERARSV